MSKNPADNVSDDEFQDAVSDVINTGHGTSNGKRNDKNTKAQHVEDSLDQRINNLNLNEEIFEDAETEKPHIFCKGDSAEYMEEIIDEDKLAELEKSMTAEQLKANKDKAHQLKLEANDFFKNDKATDAIELYTEALQLCPTTESKERAILYGNRAAAKIKLDLKKSALDDCTQAIQLWPEYVRAILRRAKLHEHLDKLDEALADYKRVYELDPGQQEARAACLRLPPIVNERNEKLKAECIDKLKELGNMILKPFGLSTANFQMQQDPNTGNYNINFNQNQN